MTGPGTQTLVMDLQRELADLRAQLAERDATITRQSEALAKAKEALQCMIELHQHANDGAFENGVTDPTGSIDEGNVRASRIYDYARAAVRAIDEVMK